jgi:RHS repeat-associated protein
VPKPRIDLRSERHWLDFVVDPTGSTQSTGTSGSYTYDPNGNEAWKTKSTEKWNYQFNSLDQLTKVVKGTKSGSTWTWTTPGEYWYDANGARAKSVEGTTTTEYVYRGHDPLFEKNTGTGVIADYIYANGRMVAKQTGSDIYYYIKDALGSTRLVYRGTSQVFSVATYAPFGTPVTPSGTEKFRYAGEMLVGAAGSSPGLYYIGARWMDPELGRWLSLDPQLGSLSAPQTMNRYAYCVNNPLKFKDPTGQTVIGYESGSAAGNRVEESWAAWNSHLINYGKPDLFAVLDEAAYYVGFVPGIDFLADGYFTLRAWQRGDELGVGIGLGCLLIPGMSGSYVRGGKAVLKYADDVPISRLVRSSDDAARALRNAEKTGVGNWYHLLPVQHGAFFESKGLDIDMYLYRIDRGPHQILHGQKVGGIKYMDWNAEWGDWITDYGKSASRGDVIQQMETMMSRFGL